MPSGMLGRRDVLRAVLLAPAIPGCWRSISAPPALPAAPLSTPWPHANAILERIARPRIPTTTFHATSFGARGDGRTDDTDALQSAIDACHARGGGRVLLPAATFRTGALRLKSRVELRLDGATLRFSDDPERFPPVRTRYEGLECVNRSPMIHADGETDIALTGTGTLDASATARWNRGSDRAGILEPLVASGASPERRVVVDRLRTSTVEMIRCARVLVEGVTLTGAPFWQIHPTLCTDVMVDGVTTRDSGPNSDGCNPESCDGVVIRRCSFASGDDNIALKSGRDEDGRRIAVPCRNVVIVGCQAEGRFGFVACGSEQSGGIENVYAFANRTFGGGVGHALWIKSNPRRGGFTRNVNMSGFTGRVRDTVAVLTMSYDRQSGSLPPAFERIRLDDLAVEAAGAVLEVEGRADSPIREFALSDSTFTDVAAGDQVRHAQVSLRGVMVNGRPVR